MNIQDIKENIRFFKPNDPYYYEVDNLPLIDLLNNDKILRDEINAILTSYANFASENYVQTNIQNAIGSAGIVDIDGDGTLPTNVIAWVNAQNFLTESATSVGDLLDVDIASTTPVAGDTLVYDTAGAAVDGFPKWVPGVPGQRIQYLPQRKFIIGQEKTVDGTDTIASVLGSDKPQGTIITHDVQPPRIDTYDPVTLIGTPLTTYPGEQYKGGSNANPGPGEYINNHTTFTWIRTLKQLGLPENAKLIYIRWAIQAHADYSLTDSTNHPHDHFYDMYHQHASYVPQRPRINPGNSEAGLEDGTMMGTELITTDHLQHSAWGHADDVLDIGQFVIHYSLPLHNVTTTDVTPNVPWASMVQNITLPGNSLWITCAFYGKNRQADMMLYVYAYEAWD